LERKVINVPFQRISATDVQSLISNSVREGKTLEYKQELPTNRDDEKKEFLNDVSSFANASGGDLLFGITEARDAYNKTTGIPNSAQGLTGINADHEIRRLENMIRDGIEPRIPGVQIRAIDGFSSGPAILIRIPKSWASPHMVTFKASPRFFSRNSAGKAPLDVAEIRAAFVQSEALPEKIRQFRQERLGNILAGETPVTVSQAALTVLHLVPVESFHNSSQIDVMAFLDQDLHLAPVGSSGGNRRLNIDGFVTYSGNEIAGKPQFDYAQLFRNGSIEAVDASLLSGDENGKDFIPSVAFERDIIYGGKNYFGAYLGLGINGPVVAMLSLLNVRGFYMLTSGIMFRGTHRIDKQNLLIPEVVIEDLSIPVEMSFRPMFDLVWQACGIRRSMNYDEHGNWKSR
jgi:hypothetical protein